MDELETKRVMEINKEIQDSYKALINKFNDELAKINVGDDPHTPVIVWLQVNLMQAAAEYLIINGLKASEALKLTIEVTSDSAKRWYVSVKELRGSKYALNKRE